MQSDVINRQKEVNHRIHQIRSWASDLTTLSTLLFGACLSRCAYAPRGEYELAWKADDYIQFTFFLASFAIYSLSNMLLNQIHRIRFSASHYIESGEAIWAVEIRRGFWSSIWENRNPTPMFFVRPNHVSEAENDQSWRER